MFNILVSIRIWKNKWYSKSVQFFCDYEAVVTILKSGKTKDDLPAKIVRNTYMEAALADIFLCFTHISGKCYCRYSLSLGKFRKSVKANRTMC